MSDLASSLVPGLLQEVHATGALAWADVHVAQKLGHLYGEGDQRVQLALALAVRALRAGSTCLELSRVGSESFEHHEELVAVPDHLWPDASTWRAAIACSPLTREGEQAPGDRPLRLVGDRLYLERYWQEESIVADQLRRHRATAPDPPEAELLQAARRELLSNADPDQAVAAIMPSLAGVTVIAGGPGTGKTRTLARLLAVLHRTLPRPPLIALAAPTGKAALRMQEALSESFHDPAAPLPADLVESLSGLNATTIHRLLGWVPGSRTRFVHHQTNPLPHDVVVIDETSMVNVTLMARLLAALRPAARLVLIGDPDQLAPVEAGAVLADIVAVAPPAGTDLPQRLGELDLPPSGPVVRLRHNYRSVAGITALADAVRLGEVEQALYLATVGGAGVRFAQSVSETELAEQITATNLKLVAAARAGQVGEAVAALDEHRLLCAHRGGPYGVSTWSRQVEQWLIAALPDFDPAAAWYPGRPLLVTQNSPELGIFNGDTGVVVQADGTLQACFARGHEIHRVSPFLLDAVQTIHAMTVHKAQGSQFERVSIILPPPESPLLTQELLYTAITRAKTEVTLIGTSESLALAVGRRARRASGLKDRL